MCKNMIPGAVVVVVVIFRGLDVGISSEKRLHLLYICSKLTLAQLY